MSLDCAARTPVRELMTRDVVCVAPGTSLYSALERMVAENVGSVLVSEVGDGAAMRRSDVHGMVPVFFALRELIGGRGALPVESVMIADCVDARADESIAEVLPRIRDNRTWRLIVSEGDSVVGILSATDVIRCMGNRGGTMIEIGVDTAFHNIDITWRGRTAQFRRDGEFVTDVDDVVAIGIERRNLSDSEQVVMLLRLDCGNGSVRVLFLDADPVQSNVREVAPHLYRLDDVFDWLLDPGYAHRQGDVGIYSHALVPAAARRISVDEYPDAFEPILSKRHQLRPADACEFFVGDETWFVRVGNGVRLVHPEHHAIPLAAGVYELRGARGTPLPSFSGLRAHEVSALGE